MKLSRRGLFAALIGAPVALPGIVMAAAKAAPKAEAASTNLNLWGAHLNEKLALRPRQPSDYVSDAQRTHNATMDLIDQKIAGWRRA